MTKEEIESLVAKARPGWRVLRMLAGKDESCPSYEVTIERGGETLVVMLSDDARVVTVGRITVENAAGQETIEIIGRWERGRGAWGIDEA